jgi:hypothetical protein
MPGSGGHLGKASTLMSPYLLELPPGASLLEFPKPPPVLLGCHQDGPERPAQGTELHQDRHGGGDTRDRRLWLGGAGPHPGLLLLVQQHLEALPAEALP